MKQCALASLHVELARGRTRASVVAHAETTGNQAPAYFDGIWTVNTLRPLRRRRARTARPHFVSIRARKPCLRTRLVLRGRYVGLPIMMLEVTRYESRRFDWKLPALRAPLAAWQRWWRNPDLASENSRGAGFGSTPSSALATTICLRPLIPAANLLAFTNTMRVSRR